MLSHKPRTVQSRGIPPRSNATEEPLPPVSRSIRNYGDLNSTSLAPKRASVVSASSSGRQSSGSADSNSRPPHQRTSALPRSTSSSSQARLSYIASTRPMPSFAGKSPPLQALNLTTASSSIPRLDTTRNISPMELGRPSRTPMIPTIDTEEDTVFGIVMPSKPKTRGQTSLPPRLIPELQALAARGGKPVNLASSSISSIGSPSTQITTTSSPWSTSTTATTPLSWSSASPSVVQASQLTSSKRSRTVPIPGNVRTHMPKLPVLKESNMSNSSSKAALNASAQRDMMSSRVRASPTPTPPPRSSSANQIKSRSNSVSTTKSDYIPPSNNNAQPPPLPIMTSNLTALPPHVPHEVSKSGTRTRSDVNQGHSRLQQAINSGAAGPSKHSTQASAQRSEEKTTSKARQLLDPAPIAQSGHRRLLSRSRSHPRAPSTSEPEPQKQSARSRLAKFSRLALFGRSKTPVESEPLPSKAQNRKGPAAGTGHEGYGRFAKRGRKQSTESNAIATESDTSVASTSRKPYDRRRRSRMSSQDQSDLEDFASSRMKPVVLVGGSRRGRTNPFPPLPKNAQHSDVSLSTVCSGDSYPPHTQFASQEPQQFPSDDNIPRSTLATRRSQKFAASEESFRFPEPIDTQNLTATPCLDSRNTTQSSDIATPASDMHKLDLSLLDKQRKKSRKLKWNIFRRKESISGPIDISNDGFYSSPEMPVNVAAVPVSRAVPYYAMIGPEPEGSTNTTVGQFIQEAAISPDKEDATSIIVSEDEFDVGQFSYRESLLLPTAPMRQWPKSVSSIPMPPPVQVPVVVVPETETQPQRAPEYNQKPPTKRQPRLAQVGRIPKVVLTSQQNEPSLKATQQPPFGISHQPKRQLQHKQSQEKLPRLNTSSRSILRPRASSSSKAKEEVFDLVRRPRQSPTDDMEFMRISDVGSSNFTSSTDSTGIISIMGPTAESTIHQGDAFRLSKRQTIGLGMDDEVWHEYNDIMDDIMSPSQLAKSPPNLNIDIPTHNKIVPSFSRQMVKNQGLAIVPAPVPATRIPKIFLDTPPLVSLSSFPSLREMPSSEEIRLRRSRIAPALHTSSYASFAPSSPLSMRDLIEEYGRPESGKFSERLSTSSSQPQQTTPALAPLQREQSQGREYENAAHLEDIERTRNPTRHSDRSYASLMVSRWLSFGRVLFSPAHSIFEKTPGKHVLVIDGLGSEDWSIYCSVTYQSQSVYVHDLKERRTAKSRPPITRPAESIPSNHRRAEVTSFNNKFPFPEEFFTAIVIRFPPAMPDTKLKNIVNECRRVLCPGGYLELVVLDLDIVNMGVQTRRAIKDLKIKMSAVDPNISLKPIIDNVQTVLGSNGFPNLSRCVVGVPVVGKPATSLDSSSESRSSSGSMAHQRRSSAGPRPYGNSTSQANFSLNDLVADYSDNADAKIGRVVSRTARSWWQHCFEASIMTDGNKSKSVFTSREVLNECKARAANFKLLIAYTQKPIPFEQKQRTMSEPTVPTLATAGIIRTAKT